MLRVSGLNNDKELYDLLHREWPAAPEYNHGGTQISLNEVEHFGDVHSADVCPHRAPLMQFVKRHASVLSSVAYTVGNAGMIMSAWANGKDKDPDFLKMYSGGAYTVATLSLMAMAHHADNPRDIKDILSEVYPLSEGQEQQEGLAELRDSVVSFMRKHPWEIASAINTTAGAANVISAAKRSMDGEEGAPVEALSALGTLSAMLMIVLAPHEKEGVEQATIPKQYDLLSTTDTLDQGMSKSGGFFGAVNRFKDWMMDNPMTVSAMTQVAANVGFGVSAFRSEPVDKGMALASGAWLTANAFQTQADTSREIAFDDVVTAAAELIYHDPNLQDVPREVIDRRISQLAGVLEEQHEVGQRSKLLAQGINQRLDRIHSEHVLEEIPLATSRDKALLKENPFSPVSHVQRLLQNNAGSGTELAR